MLTDQPQPDYTTMTRAELIAKCKEQSRKGYSTKKKAELVALLLQTPTHEKNTSPLRYPGGKTRAISILETYVRTYSPGRMTLLSPFFGGGSFELYMKTKGYTIHGNDLFVPLYTFWKTQQADCATLIQHIRAKLPITKEVFQGLRGSIMGATDEYDMASSYYCINRCSFSGATMCGGFSKEASEKRCTESSIQRLSACDTSDIVFTNLDCNAFLAANPQTDATVVYADPPYYIDTYIYGKDGDMHETFDHASFAASIQGRSDWIISYNDCAYIRNLYKDCRIFPVQWAYGMNASKESSEILILPGL